MICDRCGQHIPVGEEMEHFGQTLCEECYIQALSPARACDPWAVRSAQSLSQLDEAYSELSETQTAVISVNSLTGRNAGRFRFLETEVGLRVTDLEKAHQISETIGEAVRRQVPMWNGYWFASSQCRSRCSVLPSR